MLCVVEDAHWCDPTTLEVLEQLAHRVPELRVLVIITSLPEFEAPWTASHTTALTLTRLSRAHVATMVERLTAGKALPPEVLAQILAKSDGVPLFVEELTKTILESGLVREVGERYALSGPLPPLAIPATVQDSLMARLDRLAPVKEVAQLGAVLGREFASALLAAVTPMSPPALHDALDQLVRAGLLFRRGQPPEARYRFKHALVQEAAYASLLRSRRQELHLRIATVLEARFPGIAETEPGVVARHYTEAGLTEQAIVYWQRAGQRAIERSAYTEAVAHLTTGLEVLTTLPDTLERNQFELDLQIALGHAWRVTKGFAAPEVEHAFARARALCQRGRDTPQRFSALYGLLTFYLNRAQLQIARELGEQLLSLAHRLDDAFSLIEAHGACGVTDYFLGALPTAHRHLEQSIALYGAQQHQMTTSRMMVDLINVAEVLWLFGYPTQALRQTHKALTMAQEQSSVFPVALTLSFALVPYVLRREGRIVLERAETVLALAAEHEFT